MESPDSSRSWNWCLPVHRELHVRPTVSASPRKHHRRPQPAQLAQPLTHDAYFHTVLGMLDIATPYYQGPLDALAACREGVG